MTISAGRGSEPVDEGAPAVVVGRTIGGILLVVIDSALTLAGALWYFIVTWCSWATEGFGGALGQRARTMRFDPFIEVSQA